MLSNRIIKNSCRFILNNKWQLSLQAKLFFSKPSKAGFSGYLLHICHINLTCIIPVALDWWPRSFVKLASLRWPWHSSVASQVTGRSSFTYFSHCHSKMRGVSCPSLLEPRHILFHLQAPCMFLLKERCQLHSVWKEARIETCCFSTSFRFNHMLTWVSRVYSFQPQ